MTRTAVQATQPPVTHGAGSASRRWLGAAVATGAAGLLGLAAWMEPAAEGLGTHTQLNMPPCTWIAAADVPCPTCGMTTAFAHAADGHLVAAVLAQPFGAALALATAIAFVVGSYTAATGSRVAVLFHRLWGRRTAWALGIGFVAAWLFKIVSYKGLVG